MRTFLPAVLILSLFGCEYSAPIQEDREQPLNVIAGTISAIGVEQPSHAVLLVTNAANPGPPAGTGSPTTFTTVPGTAFSEPTSVGLSGASWAVTNVPDGEWVVSGFMDQDNDFYFSSQISVLAGATCGDVIGAHIDLATGELAAVAVEGGELADDVAVTIGTRLTTERPAFTIEATAIDASSGNGSTISIATASGNSLFPQQFRLQATGVHTDIPGLGEFHLDGPFDPAAPAPCQTGFLTRVVDANGDGLPDEPPGLEGNGLLDVWPRVYLSYLGATEDGSTWAGQAFVSPLMRATLAGENNGYDDDGDGTVDESWDIPLNGPAYFPSLDISWVPAAVRTSEDGSQEVVRDPSQLPLGEWAVTVIEETGQTWTLPNQLASWPSIDADFDAAAQAGTLTVAP